MPEPDGMPNTRIPPADPFYSDGAFYDALYASQDIDLQFYLEEAIWSGGPVLELACGTGRLAIPIAGAGVPIVGMDLSETMLAQARAKAPAQSWCVGDMRNFELDCQFALVLLAFNALQHLHTDEDVDRLCGCVKRHLLPNGRFLLDVFNPKLDLLLVPPDKRRPVGQLKDPAGRGTLRVEERRYYDQATRLVHSTWYTSLNGQRDYQITHLNLRCFFPKELSQILGRNGFTVEKIYGDFTRKPFCDDDDKVILLCRGPL